MGKELTGVYRQRRGGLTIYKPKDEKTVTRVDFNKSFDEVGRFNFDATDDGGSQMFLQKMLKHGFRDCVIRQKGTKNEMDRGRKVLPARELG